jgi:hypothetical protein
VAFALGAAMAVRGFVELITLGDALRDPPDRSEVGSWRMPSVHERPVDLERCRAGTMGGP